MRLEQFRENNIGTTAAWLPTLGNGMDAMVYLTYLQFVNSAFYVSAQQIEELESSMKYIHQGSGIQTAVGLWFMSIESYINVILKISCLAQNLSFNEIKKKDLGSRLSMLFNILKIDRVSFYSGTFQQLEEFKQYRNELFHDRTNDKLLKFRKTVFSGNPFYANQVDVMQAAIIGIQIFDSFRYVIPRLDLMPQVMIKKEDSFFFKKIDCLFNDILGPYFQYSLAKHSLTSDLDLSITVPRLEQSSVFVNTPIEILIKVDQDSKYHATPSMEKTQIGVNLFNRIREGMIFDTEKLFQIANFYR